MDAFVEIKPFGQDDNHLALVVVSDHAEIVLTRNNFMDLILAWNISNPLYHPYFKSSKTFQETHLAIEKPYSFPVGNLMHSFLQNKIDTQLDTFYKNFVDQKFPIQVIIEGFDYFYDCLTRRLAGLDFEIIKKSTFDDQGVETKNRRNKSGILVDTSIYNVWKIGSTRDVIYCEKDNNGLVEKTTTYPVALLSKKKSNEEKFMVIAAHVNGCNSQYPEGGLIALRDLMLELRDRHMCDIIAIGDFNTPPVNALKVFDKNFTIMSPNYLTHCNPNAQAAKYDMAVVLPYNAMQCEMLDMDHISSNSQMLVHSINKALI